MHVREFLLLYLRKATSNQNINSIVPIGMMSQAFSQCKWALAQGRNNKCSARKLIKPTSHYIVINNKNVVKMRN